MTASLPLQAHLSTHGNQILGAGSPQASVCSSNLSLEPLYDNAENKRRDSQCINRDFKPEHEVLCPPGEITAIPAAQHDDEWLFSPDVVNGKCLPRLTVEKREESDGQENTLALQYTCLQIFALAGDRPEAVPDPAQTTRETLLVIADDLTDEDITALSACKERLRTEGKKPFLSAPAAAAARAPWRRGCST